MRSNIAATARVRVLQPRAAYILAPLDEFEILDSSKVPNDLYGEPEAGHAGADYEDFGVKRHGDVWDWSKGKGRDA